MLNMVNHPITAPSTTSWWFFTNPSEKYDHQKWIHLPPILRVKFKTYLSCHHHRQQLGPNNTVWSEFPVESKALGCNPFKEISSKALMALFGNQSSTPGPQRDWCQRSLAVFGMFHFCFSSLSTVVCTRKFSGNYFSWYIVMNRSKEQRSTYTKKIGNLKQT